MEKISINKSAIIDLVNLKSKFDSIIESLELMGNEEFMKSYEKSKEQIINKDFVDWDEL